jgi:hypothetical protein
MTFDDLDPDELVSGLPTDLSRRPTVDQAPLSGASLPAGIYVPTSLDHYFSPTALSGVLQKLKWSFEEEVSILLEMIRDRGTSAKGRLAARRDLRELIERLSLPEGNVRGVTTLLPLLPQPANDGALEMVQAARHTEEQINALRQKPVEISDEQRATLNDYTQRPIGGFSRPPTEEARPFQPESIRLDRPAPTGGSPPQEEPIDGLPALPGDPDRK